MRRRDLCYFFQVKLGLLFVVNLTTVYLFSETKFHSGLPSSRKCGHQVHSGK